MKSTDAGAPNYLYIYTSDTLQQINTLQQQVDVHTTYNLMHIYSVHYIARG